MDTLGNSPFSIIGSSDFKLVDVKRYQKTVSANYRGDFIYSKSPTGTYPQHLSLTLTKSWEFVLVIEDGRVCGDVQPSTVANHYITYTNLCVYVRGVLDTIMSPGWYVSASSTSELEFHAGSGVEKTFSSSSLWLFYNANL